MMTEFTETCHQAPMSNLCNPSALNMKLFSRNLCTLANDMLFEDIELQASSYISSNFSADSQK